MITVNLWGWSVLTAEAASTAQQQQSRYFGRSVLTAEAASTDHRSVLTAQAASTDHRSVLTADTASTDHQNAQTYCCYGCVVVCLFVFCADQHGYQNTTINEPDMISEHVSLKELLYVAPPTS